MAWSDMPTNMVHIGYYQANTCINMDRLWKTEFKILKRTKMMSKIKARVKFWPFPLCFGPF